jgi:membrane-bound lytic murein transglycosylase A
MRSCLALRSQTAWSAVCAEAEILNSRHPDSKQIRSFFEKGFSAFRVTTTGGNDHGLITGYYEPLLHGSRSPVAPFLTPLYSVPDDLITVDLAEDYPQLKGLTLRGKIDGQRLVAYPSRADLAGNAAPRGKELVWVDDPVAAFFLQVQGSGRIELFEGDGARTVIRLAYADQNGRPYRAIGRWLVDQGELTLDQVSMQSIEDWARSHPDRVDSLLNANPSYVFFKEESIDDPSLGPKGALGVPLTPGRSIAIDPRVLPLGAPVFLESPDPLNGATAARLTLAQDTGGAIRARADQPVRADLFCGFGAEAALRAGTMKENGRMWVLLPKGMPPTIDRSFGGGSS